MKRIITVLLFISSFAFGQNGFYQLDFESTGGYSTSISEFSDISENTGNDFFIRTIGTEISSNYSVVGGQGTTFFAAQDIDGEGANSTQNLSISGINISGQTGLVFSILIAEDDDGLINQDWDADTYFHISGTIDGGSKIDMIRVEAIGGTNTEPAIDTDFNGEGDGVRITENFTEFTFNFVSNGNILDLLFEFGNLDAGEEDIAIDNIRIGSNETPLPVELTTFSAYISEQNVELIWETATEVNNYGFEVERKINRNLKDGSTEKNNLEIWEEIGFEKGYGNSNSPKKYSYLDESISEAGKYSYRLKQIDIDGKSEYSNVVEVEVGIPIEFEVAQNYPNPFNPSTTISFSIPTKANVQVVIYNMLGQGVKTLVNSVHEAGMYKYNFNASNLSSGTYIYRVTSGSNFEVRKMILLK